jgi:hypothetical protein
LSALTIFARTEVCFRNLRSRQKLFTDI